MELIDFLDRISKCEFKGASGSITGIKLLEPLTQSELEQVRCLLPCSMPAEMEACLSYSRGLELVQEKRGKTQEWSGSPNVINEVINWSGLCSDGQYLEEIMPCSVSIATDGFGNSWNIDITKAASNEVWGPVYFVCHDPPVLVYQCSGLEAFLVEVVRELEYPGESQLSLMLKQFAMEVWSKNPGLLPQAEALMSNDGILNGFAQELDDSYVICDMRSAKLGDGFSWGRFGADAVLKRFYDLPVYAYKRNFANKRSWWKRLLGI